MAQYDGVIRIVTDITTKDAKESLSSLEYQIKKSAKEINLLRSKMDALKDQKVPTKEFKDLQGKLSEAEKEMEKMIAQDSKLANLDTKIKKLSSSAADLAEKMKNAEVRTPTEEYKTLEDSIEGNRTELERLLKEQKRLSREGIGKGIDKQYLVAAEAAERLKYQLQQAVAAGDKDAYLETEERLNRVKSILQELMAKEPRPLGKIQAYYAIEHKIEDIKNNIFSAEDEMRKLSEAGKDFTVNTDSPEYQKFASQYESVNQELEKTKSLHSEIAQKQAESVQKVAELKARISQLVKEGKDFTLGQDTAEFASYARQIQYEEKAIEAAGKHYKELMKLQPESYKKLRNTVKKSFNSIQNALKKANSLVDSFGARIKNIAQKHLPLFRKESERAKSSLSGFGSRLKSLALSLLIFNQLRKIFSSSTSAIRTGFENLYNENEKFRNSIENLKASLATLKNALAAAFAPIVEIAIPYIQRLVEWLTDAVNLIGQLIAALTGRKTYTKAIRQSASASEDAADAIEDETDAMNKQLSPLDKLNNLTSESNKDKSKDSGVGTGGGTMFEEVPIEGSILEAAEKIKDILSKLFAPLKAAWDREGQFVMDSWKYALGEVWQLIKDIGRDFLTVWQEEATVDILENILHIIGDIGLIVGHLARNFREAWNENEVGLNILRNIRDIIGIIVQHIRNMADATVEWADKLDFYPILDAFNRFLQSIKPVVDAIWGIIEDFYTKVLLPLGKWTIEKGLPELLQVFIDFNNKVDWESLRKNIAAFWEHLEPFAETVGEGLIIFIDRVADALADFLNSQEFKDFLVTVEEWMDSVTPEDVADALENIAKGLIALKLALLGFSAISAITGVLTTIKTFLSFFGVGGGAAGAGAAMESTAVSARMLATALGDLMTAISSVGFFDVAVKNPLFDLMEAMGADADKIDLMREKYGKLGGTIDIVKDTWSLAKNTLQGYGAVISDTSQLSKALEKAMNDIANGTIYTDEHMAQLKERFGATDDDLEMLRQEMLDTNPALRELADGFPALATASAESLEQINKGMQYMENGVTDADDIIFRLNHSFRELTPTTEAFFNQMANNSLDDFNYAIQTGEQVIDGYVASLENTSGAVQQFSNDIAEAGEHIGGGLTRGMEEADMEGTTTGFFDKVVASIKSVFGIASPATQMMPFGEYILLGVVEGFRSMFGEFTTLISQLFTQISSKFTSGMNAVKNVWASAWSSLPNTVKNIINSIMSMVSSFVSSLSSAFGKVSSFGSKISSAFKGGTSTYSMQGFTQPVSPVVAALSNVEIPAYATGQVIPRTMKQHLAILGDNSQETEVVSPLSTMKQALAEALVEAGIVGGNNEGGDIVINIDGREVFRVTQKHAREYKKRTRKPAFG